MVLMDRVKSYVINALIALGKSWLRDGSILVTAISGNAACNVGGVTIASVIHSKKNILKNVRLMFLFFVVEL